MTRPDLQPALDPTDAPPADAFADEENTVLAFSSPVPPPLRGETDDEDAFEVPEPAAVPVAIALPEEDLLADVDLDDDDAEAPADDAGPPPRRRGVGRILAWGCAGVALLGLLGAGGVAVVGVIGVAAMGAGAWAVVGAAGTPEAVEAPDVEPVVAAAEEVAADGLEAGGVGADVGSAEDDAGAAPPLDAGTDAPATPPVAAEPVSAAPPTPQPPRAAAAAPSSSPDDSRAAGTSEAPVSRGAGPTTSASPPRPEPAPAAGTRVALDGPGTVHLVKGGERHRVPGVVPEGRYDLVVAFDGQPEVQVGRIRVKDDEPVTIACIEAMGICRAR